MSHSVDLTDEEFNKEDLGYMKSSGKISCCYSDIDEFEKLKQIESEVFKDGKKDIIPEYLKSDFPPEE